MDKIPKVKCINCGALSPKTNVNCWKCNKKLAGSPIADSTAVEAENQQKPKSTHRGLALILALLSAFVILFVSILFGILVLVLSTLVIAVVENSSKGATPVVVTVVKVKCAECGELNESDAVFCKKCSHKLAPAK